MQELLAQADSALAAWCSPVMRSLLWGTLTGVLSMAVYALIAPQEKLRNIKAEQKANKAVLKAYDGDFAGLQVLIKKDLGYSLKMVGLSLFPFAVSVAPAFALMFRLEPLYENVLMPGVGVEWSANFAFWFIVAAIVSSLAVKIGFKIT